MPNKSGQPWPISGTQMRVYLGADLSHWADDELLGMVQRLWDKAGRAAWPKEVFQALVCPAIAWRQCAFVCDCEGKPRVFASWAFLSQASERRLLSGCGPVAADDWQSGDSLWLVDWLAPLGGSLPLAMHLRRHVFAQSVAMALRMDRSGASGSLRQYAGKGASKAQRDKRAEQIEQVMLSACARPGQDNIEPRGDFAQAGRSSGVKNTSTLVPVLGGDSQSH